MNVPKIGQFNPTSTPGHLPNKSLQSTSGLKLPPKGSAIKILPKPGVTSTTDDGQKVLKLKLKPSSSAMQRSSSKQKLA